jgi:hypothetical protein
MMGSARHNRILAPTHNTTFIDTITEHFDASSIFNRLSSLFDALVEHIRSWKWPPSFDSPRLLPNDSDGYRPINDDEYNSCDDDRGWEPDVEDYSGAWMSPPGTPHHRQRGPSQAESYSSFGSDDSSSE